ncbi:putative Carboxymuconolactone decarboxylase [Legionella lansingensis]|uniref:Putative Carboxymuconolactone decarboxylase n=1 Tax=Legionella lansingensis TaxID=45067 RepID=A0A0W0VQ98_9GAMM|nr:carboxymuconolactone decarboxylase family protein [Legionella lansingensis]KTD22273.1 putative Carboxymuconolactone decarboxylase [Legionella lansingensis]SNV50610.1 putative Carboxymuconolactone decarboxylase [Legionella lansingensis]
MSYIKLSSEGGTPFERLLGYVPEILKKWSQLENAFFQSSSFDPEFLEQVRRTLAYTNRCQYCMAKAGKPDENPASARLACALRFANRYALAGDAIDKQCIEELKEYFSDSELVELIAFCSFISASQKFGASLGLQPQGFYSD